VHFSRQRVWGVPIPIFYCEDCGEPLVNEATIEKVADIFEKEGSDAWWAHPAEELLPEGTKCAKCGGTHFRKEKDIMDVWFDSGSSHMGVLQTSGTAMAGRYVPRRQRPAQRLVPVVPADVCRRHGPRAVQSRPDPRLCARWVKAAR
jgi:isoleucyl-tRNA synthetase